MKGANGKYSFKNPWGNQITIKDGGATGLIGKADPNAEYELIP